MRQVGRYAPKNTIVLHPYGRYSNAFKFAGEVDVLEALAHAQKHYRIDDDRISARGFSMGGAACWQFAVHYADRWFAANPGAGFSETPEFLAFFQKEVLRPTWYERRLWTLYDCPGYAINLYHCPTVAYSGELDIQKQAADVMETALKKVNIDLVHIIGPKTKHTIHRDSMKEIEARMAALAKTGRQRNPRKIRFDTFTLKYKPHALGDDRHAWRPLEAIDGDCGCPRKQPDRDQHTERDRSHARFASRADTARRSEPGHNQHRRYGTACRPPEVRSLLPCAALPGREGMAHRPAASEQDSAH